MDHHVITAHELANYLYQLPDLPIAVHANGSTYMGEMDKKTHGPLNIGLLKTSSGKHIVIGNFEKYAINKPNWYVTKLYVGRCLR